MKSRRPPLNLSEPKLRSRSRAAPNSPSDTPEGLLEDSVEDATESEAADDSALAGNLTQGDVLNAPLNEAAVEAEDDPLENDFDIPSTLGGRAADTQQQAPQPALSKIFRSRATLSQAAPQPAPEPVVEPVAERAPEPAPERIAETVTAEKSHPDNTIHLSTPPPDAAPPVRRSMFNPRAHIEAEKVETSKRDMSAIRHEPEGVLKTTGGSPVLFWGATAFISLLWAFGLAAFVLGAQNDLRAFAVAPFRLAVLVFLAIFPIGLIFATAFALRNAAALSKQAQRAAALADSMLAPATSAAMQTNELVDALRAQVDHAVRAVRLAHTDITELSAMLKSETERLQDAAQVARAATQSVTRSLEHEREAVTQMSDHLGAQANGIIDAVDRQARMVADASDLAQTQLREAEATLTVRASDMMNAASEVSTTARLISEDLDRQTQRLETAGSGVADQIRSVEEGLSQQRAGLVSAALSLRADQEDFAVHIENQRAQLTEALAITRVATVDLGETSARGVDVLRDIVLTAQENFRAVMGAAENERTAFETRVHATLSNISVMAADARDDLVNETRRSLDQLTAAASEAKRAADAAAQTAQGRVDRLNESIFEASKKADEVFDARFSAARRLIEDSADLINEAGDQTAEKLDSSFAHTRQAIAEVNEALNELTHSADQLPLMAQDRLHDIRKSVEDGLLAMTAAARKAALETEAVDQAFQERVKRNYDMLTEAVRLMGVISGDQPLSSAGGAAIAQATSAESFRDRDYGRLNAPRRTEPPLQPTPQPAPQRTAPPPQSQQSAPQAAAERRLRLTPLSAETRTSPGPQPTPAPTPAAQRPEPQRPETQRVAQPPAPGKAGGQDGWSWRDLLNGMEGREPMAAPVETSVRPVTQAVQHHAPEPPLDAEFDSLDELMVAEVNAMGVDAAALLSRSRIDEMISSIMAEDNEGARMMVRRVAPAAIRRLSRRLMSDPGLRQHANDFATYYDQQINIALMSRDVSRSLQEVLSNDTGRAYLLVDAAISDLI